ncbi:ribosomal protein S18 acetylase RimI-like enzyme [Leeuwenhoekiella aestuarii]|uniref:Ribosomal protein S18 acetylase RimI-like enzyme n=1 Tax=Leeuwenhoekiella aestuarii TaxID=2249426 RepID=A0A4Q0NYX9_9FLAO|nr:GNAT family N-acetyltransferase [Leeuwenhoekiella aestuarii]RXG16206.1 ribosomal protein S18 acetylase RimI-like enzyme [Leeuwenhoekiella aestuarii]RXG16899.1 ribosomal protein S18 acetylase RimI-like enzyme [Leeuwenhoekiella aestuarii]
MPEINIRRVTKEDTDFILSLLPSLTDPELPHWRDPDVMLDIDQRILKSEIQDGSEDNAIFIAEDSETQKQLGFIFLEIGTDYYHREPHGHIADIIVAPDARGRGIGKLLMNKAEAWTKDCGYKLLTLNVFDDNKKARKLYQSLGFTPDLTKYGKIL